MTDAQKTEPAGVGRFRAVSADNAPVAPVAAPKPLSPEASVELLEARLTELEHVVHALAPGVGDKHGVVPRWLAKIGARIKATVGKL